MSMTIFKLNYATTSIYMTIGFPWKLRAIARFQNLSLPGHINLRNIYKNIDVTTESKYVNEWSKYN